MFNWPAFVLTLLLLGGEAFVLYYAIDLQKNVKALKASPTTLTAAQQTTIESQTKTALIISIVLLILWVVVALLFLLVLKLKIFEFFLISLIVAALIGVQVYILYTANKQSKAIDLTQPTASTTTGALSGLASNIQHLLYVSIGAVVASAIVFFFSFIGNQRRSVPSKKRKIASITVSKADAGASATADVLVAAVTEPVIPKP